MIRINSSHVVYGPEDVMDCYKWLWQGLSRSHKKIYSDMNGYARSKINLICWRLIRNNACKRWTVVNICRYCINVCCYGDVDSDFNLLGALKNYTYVDLFGSVDVDLLRAFVCLAWAAVRDTYQIQCFGKELFGEKIWLPFARKAVI